MHNTRNVDDQADIADWLIPDAVWEFVGFGRPVKAPPAPASKQSDIGLEA